MPVHINTDFLIGHSRRCFVTKKCHRKNVFFFLKNRRRPLRLRSGAAAGRFRIQNQRQHLWILRLFFRTGRCGFCRVARTSDGPSSRRSPKSFRGDDGVCCFFVKTRVVGIPDRKRSTSIPPETLGRRRPRRQRGDDVTFRSPITARRREKSATLVCSRARVDVCNVMTNVVRTPSCH